MTAPPETTAPPGEVAERRKTNHVRGTGSRYDDTASRPAAQACPNPQSRGGECPWPLSCHCRGRKLIQALADLILRYRRGRLMVADELRLPPEAVDDLALLDADVRGSRTPEQAAAAARGGDD